MSLTLIFDLSEVLIAGLIGIEKPLSRYLEIDESSILPALSGDSLASLFRGEISEDEYIARVLVKQNWPISTDKMKAIIRLDFHQRVPKMEEVVTSLAEQYDLILLSDHAREWIEYIRLIHSFLGIFKQQLFSFDLHHTKKEEATFQMALDILGKTSAECLFVDDNARNITNARNAGIKSILFCSAEQLKDDLKIQGIYVN